MTMFYDFAEHGGKNIVLTDALLKQFAVESDGRRRIKRQAADAGLNFVDAHAPFSGEIDLMLPDDIRSIGVARHVLTLEHVHDCGVKTCCFHLGNAPVFPEYSLDELHTFICRTLEKLLKRAEELDVIICIENIFKPLNTVSEILKLIEMFDTPYLGVCYDSGHANIMENGMVYPDSRPWGQWAGRGDVEWEERILEKLLDHIVSCHLHDNNASADLHKLPGEGSVDWKYTMDLLSKAPRLHVMQSEVAPARWNITMRRLLETWQKYL
jgi:sugar phosphate isomerase/epimerase